MKRFLLLFLIFTNIIYSVNQLNVGISSFQPNDFNSAAQYSLSMEHTDQSKLSIGIGLSASQIYDASSKITTITFPSVFIKQYYKLNRLPLHLYFGGGFSINHLSSDYGTNYLGTQLLSGIQYNLNRSTVFFGEYKYQYSKTYSSSSGQISFDGPVFSIGIGQIINRPRQFKKQTSHKEDVPKPKYLKRADGPSNRTPGQSRQQKQTYDKTKKMMNNLSWPTY